MSRVNDDQFHRICGRACLHHTRRQRVDGCDCLCNRLVRADHGRLPRFVTTPRLYDTKRSVHDAGFQAEE
jgi:hypothetical protein